MEIISFFKAIEYGKKGVDLFLKHEERMKTKKLEALISLLGERSIEWMTDEERDQLKDFLESSIGQKKMKSAIESACQIKSSLGLNALAVGSQRLDVVSFSILGSTLPLVTDDYIHAFPKIVDLTQTEKHSNLCGKGPWRVKCVNQENLPKEYTYSHITQHIARGVVLGHLLPDHNFGRWGGASEPFFFGVSGLSCSLKDVFSTAIELVKLNRNELY